MDPKREAQIRTALAAGEIAEERGDAEPVATDGLAPIAATGVTAEEFGHQASAMFARIGEIVPDIRLGDHER